MTMHIRWLANARLPTEKAHGLQIVQNCHALAAAGADVALVVPRRINTPALAVQDVHAHYGVPASFRLVRVPTIDLLPWARRWEPLAARLQAMTFAACARRAPDSPPDVIYSRDVLPLLAARRGRQTRTVYEAHQLHRGRAGRALERRCLQAADLVVAVTDQLAHELRARGARRTLVLRDGFQAERFARLPDRGTARRMLGLPMDATLIGYVGRLETMGMSKGLDVLVDALARLRRPDCALVIVGGPDDAVEAIRRQWADRDLPPSALRCAGTVPPPDVALWLAAFDVCAAPFPWTVHFDRYASPLKLFEYMASGQAIVASALRSVCEVLHDARTALLVPPGDAPALAQAIGRLADDPALRARLGAAARDEAAAYAWHRRAQRLLDALANG